MQSILFYIVTVLIWGSTWLAITFQLGVVEPLVSVVYRFALAAGLLLIYCKLTGLNLRFTRQDHLYMALQGVLLFAVNYWLFYIAETVLASGLVAVVFSTMVVMNMINGAIFLRTPFNNRVMLGAVLGMSGIVLVFWPELTTFSLDDQGFYGLLLSLAATLSASLGNIASARNQKFRLPIIQSNAIGMAYGALAMFLVALFGGSTFSFEFTFSYVSSLLYLAIFGSIIAFGCYLSLVGRIGVDRAAYVTLLFPLVALALSTVYEGYRWSGLALLGVVLILVGNLLVLRKRVSVEN
jgi:drug/metabolite transporter (DMT)-like permease